MQGQFGSPLRGSVRYRASQAVCIDLSKIGFLGFSPLCACAHRRGKAHTTAGLFAADTGNYARLLGLPVPQIDQHCGHTGRGAPHPPIRWSVCATDVRRFG